MSTFFPLPCPVLPQFESLLVTGPFHASALLHLCLTHLSAKPHRTRAIIFSSSQRNVTKALIDLNDDWLNECGGYGAVSELLSNVDIHYPPTALHLKLLLSMLRIADGSDNLAHPAKATLDSPPSLLVLHELSAYFLDDSSEAPVMSAYLSLVACALSCATKLARDTNQGPRVVLMDSRMNELKLPILRRPSRMPALSEEQEQTSSYRPEPVFPLVQRYFEWSALFKNGGWYDRPLLVIASNSFKPSSPSPVIPAEVPQQKTSFTHTLRLTRQDSFSRNSQEDNILWEWNEVRRKPRGYSERESTQFLWVKKEEDVADPRS